MLSNISNGEMLTEIMKYHSTSNRMVKVQNRGITEMLERMWKTQRCFSHSGGNTKWYSHSGASQFSL